MAKTDKAQQTEFTPSKDTQARVDEFVEADKAFRQVMTDFEEKAPEWFQLIEKLRDARNRRLDDAKRQLRDEAGKLDYNKIRSFKLGPFTVEKAKNRSFSEDAFVELAETKGLTNKFKEASLIKTVTSVNRDEALDYFKKNPTLWEEFKDTYLEEDATPRVKGVDEIPPLGAPVKTK